MNINIGKKALLTHFSKDSSVLKVAHIAILKKTVNFVSPIENKYDSWVAQLLNEHQVSINKSVQ